MSVPAPKRSRNTARRPFEFSETGHWFGTKQLSAFAMMRSNDSTWPERCIRPLTQRRKGARVFYSSLCSGPGTTFGECRMHSAPFLISTSFLCVLATLRLCVEFQPDSYGLSPYSAHHHRNGFARVAVEERADAEIAFCLGRQSSFSKRRRVGRKQGAGNEIAAKRKVSPKLLCSRFLTFQVFHCLHGIAVL